MEQKKSRTDKEGKNKYISPQRQNAANSVSTFFIHQNDIDLIFVLTRHILGLQAYLS